MVKKVTIAHKIWLLREDLVKYKFKTCKAVFSFFAFLFSLIFLFTKKYFFLLPLSKAYNYGWGLSLFFSKIFFKNRRIRKDINFVIKNQLRCEYSGNKIKFKLFPYQIIVLKSPSKGGLGILYIRNNLIFGRLIESLETHKSLFSKYFLILEPSWNGYFDPNILAYWRNDFPPIGICTLEPRDKDFLSSLNNNLYCLPIGSNYWVDYRIFRPLSIAKEFDLVFVAAWAKYKRYAEIFSILSKAKKKGYKYKICLIGYPLEFKKNIIETLLIENNLADQAEIFENVTPEEVNYLLNKSKVFVLWSRFEGNNRATIESLFANTPVIMRDDFNYGHKYHFINKKPEDFLMIKV